MFSCCTFIAGPASARIAMLSTEDLEGDITDHWKRTGIVLTSMDGVSDSSYVTRDCNRREEHGIDLNVVTHGMCSFPRKDQHRVCWTWGPALTHENRLQRAQGKTLRMHLHRHSKGFLLMFASWAPLWWTKLHITTRGQNRRRLPCKEPYHSTLKDASW